MNLLSVVAAVLYGLFMRVIFGFFSSFFQVLSGSFIFLVPLGIGALTVRFSNPERVKSRAFAFFYPWLTCAVLLVLTIILSIEGFICWVIMYPIFSVMAGLGGLLMRWYMLRNLKNQDNTIGDEHILDDGQDFKNPQNLPAVALVLLPFLMAVFEKEIDFKKEVFTTYTSVEIRANAAQIWPHVARVTPIEPEEENRGINAFLGMPRPIRAELDTLAVGGHRRAIFDKGLVFDEVVFEYEHERSMAFTIHADPNEIPPTAMDEHIVIGGKYFDVLEGRYTLETLPDGSCRLHLTSRFTLHSPLNWYAGWWAQWIMKDIQENILWVLKNRAEAKRLKF